MLHFLFLSIVEAAVNISFFLMSTANSIAFTFLRISERFLVLNDFGKVYKSKVLVLINLEGKITGPKEIIIGKVQLIRFFKELSFFRLQKFWL